MQQEQSFNIVRGILRSSRFHDLPPEEKTKTLEKILLTNEISKDDLSMLLNEISEGKKIEQMLPILAKFDYNTFLNFIIRGEIKGKDLLNLCNSSKKFNDYCNRDFEVKDKDGKVIRVDTQYLFRILLDKMGIHLSFGRGPKYTYIEKVIGGNVWSFGNNSLRQFGLNKNTIKDKNIPTLIPSLSLNDIIKVANGTDDHCLCLNSQGRVWSFGNNEAGQLGLKGKHAGIFPTLIKDFNNIIEVEAGSTHSLCLDKEGRVWSFGSNEYGQLGLGDNQNRDLPTLIPTLSKIVKVSSGIDFSLCLDDQARVWSFGKNWYGILGLGDDHHRNIPNLIPDLNNIIKISTGRNHCLCLDNEGRVWSFGRNRYGQLGFGKNLLGSFNDTSIPILIPNLNDIVKICAADSFSLCLDSQGRVWGFGNNLAGQLGLGVGYNQFENLPIPIPTLIPNLNNIIEISGGDFHSLCLDNQGRVWAFGYNKEGQLGLGDNQPDNVRIPTLIPNLNNVLQVTAGYKYSLVIKF
jgi:alpha-tubulin suppressor-like RCC1 family protein